MSWKSLVMPISTADNGATPTHTQKFKIGSTVSAILNGLQVGVFLVNDPAFTLLRMEIWTDNNGVPGRLLETSTTSYLKSELLVVEDNAYRILGFKFDRIPLKAGMYYHAALRPTAYTGDDTSFIGWRTGWPDPIYRTGLNFAAIGQADFPYELAVFTEDQ